MMGFSRSSLCVTPTDCIEPTGAQETMRHERGGPTRPGEAELKSNCIRRAENPMCAPGDIPLDSGENK